MPDQFKKVMTSEKTTDTIPQGDYSDLKRLLALLNVQSSKQQLPALNFECANNSMVKSEQFCSNTSGERSRGQWQESTEAVELERFSMNYKNERHFSQHPQHELFQDIFTALVKNRLICREWANRASSTHFLRILICVRLLVRDACYQEALHNLGGIESLAQYMDAVANDYLGYGEQQHNIDKLVNMTYIFQKLSAVKDQREWVITCGAHKTLINLLGAKENNVLLGALLALTSLAESPECREKISELNVMESLLVILHEYDLLSKRLTAELLRLLCLESQIKEQVKIYEGVPILLSLLHSDHIKLLWSIVWILVQICEDPDTSAEIRIWGGIKQLLHILQGERSLFSDRSSIGSLSSANAAGRIQEFHFSEDLSPHEIQENVFSLQAACCAAITELVLNDTNAHQVVQENGVYTIAKLILPNKQRNVDKANLLQCYAFRALRFLFSMERNRHLFKRLFPTDLFESFIDVGHYVREISAYEDLVFKLNALLLYHPNVVRYYRTFLENDKLYIIMELIEGAPLGEHFHSLKEKQQHFSEERIWNIFIQLCLALRYLHKEKRIVHRDLTPNNIMLGDKDKVTITDFGLAKQKQENSKLTSVVGTILYSCPEVVKSEPYGEKADVWAVGCVLYQMATLNPPFYSTNMLSLATKIVEAAYEPVPDGIFSEKVSAIIKRCLTPDAENRPDIVEVSSMISDVMMKYLDGLSTTQLVLERKLERERRRTQRYFMEANRNAVTCHHHLAVLSQEHYEKSSLSSSSSGAASLKSDFFENTDLPEIFHHSSGKDVDKTCDEALSDDNCTTEKDVFSELDDELDVSDNSSSSSSSPLKDSAFGMIKRSFSALERQPQARDYFGITGSRPRPALLPFDLLLKAPSLMFNANVKNIEDSLVTGWKSHSLPAVILRNLKDHASAGIAVSQRKVRQISDPIQQILIQLHKIIYITQLPPTLHCNLKRRVIERFKKSLFSQQSNPCNLKAEIKKLLQGSPELIEPNFLTSDYHLLLHSSAGSTLVLDDRPGFPRTFDMNEGMTYEQMQTVIEEVLEECGYYHFTSNRYQYYPWGARNHPARR
ncbi:serine/threonine-protein kinase Nek10 isoform X7 [Anolis carolinensis]|uniref:serine/threonine-protein kinase Nek10 isoform X7 n=1 Tax=Anolis carolinensis TaxID=28377 RepID=UPI002F2B25EA